MKLLVPAVLAVMVWTSLSQTMVAAGPSEDVPLGALPADVIRGAMQKTLSPQGRFVILAATGVVRIFDTPQKIADARAALTALQNGPAIVSFAFIIKTGMHKVTKATSTGGQDVGIDFPVPEDYAPPRVVQYGRGYAVTPVTPTKFTTERVYEGGYVGGTEVNTEETSVEGGVPHRFAGSALFPKPVAVTVCAKVPDPAALHDWAVKNGAVPQNEPAWPAARSEILVTPEHADNGIVLNLQPQVVVAAANGTARVIPLRTCAASVVIKQGAPATFDGFAGADVDFYRVFMGAQESVDDALSSVTVGATVQFLPPQEPQPAQTPQAQKK